MAQEREANLSEEKEKGDASCTIHPLFVYGTRMFSRNSWNRRNSGCTPAL